MVSEATLSEFLARVQEARKAGFAVDRASIQGITLVAVPVFSPSWELLLVLTAAHSHDVPTTHIGPLSRAMQSAAAGFPKASRLLRLG